jgi:hypothetical protein
MYSLQIIPLVYVLLIGKGTDDYNSLFEQLLLKYDYEPESILVDFESATLKSTKALFPDAIQTGNFVYHLFSIKHYSYYKFRLSISLWTMSVERNSIIRSTEQVHR